MLEQLNSRLVELTSELLLIFTASGKIVYANPSAQSKLAYEPNELTTCNMVQIFRQEFPEEGQSFTLSPAWFEKEKETVMYRKNSSCFPISFRCYTLSEEENYLLIAQDITLYKDMEVRMQQLQEEGKSSLKARDELTANVTHELRTPVNGIRGHANNLLEKTKDPEQKKILEIILYCCDNMSAIINNILDFSKMEAGKFTIEEREFDFYKMMENVITTHVSEINKKELHLSVDVDESIPQYVIGDELRIVQVLNNLLSNAVKFTTVGFVAVSVSKTMHTKDEIELFFMVRDSGIGISKTEQDQLFQSFSQVDASITRRFGGTGLGLSICKQLVEMMNGNIHVESEKGKGSTFSFYIKLWNGETSENEEKRQKVYQNWQNFVQETDAVEEDFLQFGEFDNKKELRKTMEKLVLSLELSSWNKAEMMSAKIKELVESSDDEMKHLVLRLKMAVRKEDYEKSMAAYEKIKTALSERLDIF